MLVWQLVATHPVPMGILVAVMLLLPWVRSSWLCSCVAGFICGTIMACALTTPAIAWAYHDWAHYRSTFYVLLAVSLVYLAYLRVVIMHGTRFYVKWLSKY